MARFKSRFWFLFCFKPTFQIAVKFKTYLKNKEMRQEQVLTVAKAVSKQKRASACRLLRDHLAEHFRETHLWDDQRQHCVTFDFQLEKLSTASSTASSARKQIATPAPRFIDSLPAQQLQALEFPFATNFEAKTCIWPKYRFHDVTSHKNKRKDHKERKRKRFFCIARVRLATVSVQEW